MFSNPKLAAFYLSWRKDLKPKMETTRSLSEQAMQCPPGQLEVQNMQSSKISFVLHSRFQKWMKMSFMFEIGRDIYKTCSSRLPPLRHPGCKIGRIHRIGKFATKPLRFRLRWDHFSDRYPEEESQWKHKSHAPNYAYCFRFVQCLFHHLS